MTLSVQIHLNTAIKGVGKCTCDATVGERSATRQLQTGGQSHFCPEAGR